MKKENDLRISSVLILNRQKCRAGLWIEMHLIFTVCRERLKHKEKPKHSSKRREAKTHVRNTNTNDGKGGLGLGLGSTVSWGRKMVGVGQGR